MPILASFVRTATARRALVSDENRSIDFRSIDGETTVEWDGVFVRILAGALGLDKPPVEVTRDRYPGLPGARLRQVSDLEKQVFLPLLVTAAPEDWRGLNKRLAQIRSMVDYRDGDYRANEGSFDLIATADGVERRLRCEYLDGMEGNYAEDAALPEWRRFGLSLLAVDPYWKGKGWTTPTVSLPESNPFLANDAPAHPLRLSSTVAIGTDMPVFVPGDIASPAVIELIGPATTTHITSPSGLDVTIGALTAGQLFVLDTGRNRAATLGGVAAWDKVGTSPRFRPLAPGGTTISIEMSGASADSRARVYGDALWETAW